MKAKNIYSSLINYSKKFNSIKSIITCSSYKFHLIKFQLNNFSKKMSVSRFNSEKLPKPIAPYSQASLIDMKDQLMIVTSGIIGLDNNSNLVSENIEEQTMKCLEILKTIVEENKGTLDDVVKVNLYVTNLDDFSKVNAVYEKVFTSNYPARTCVQVSRLPKNAVVELEATIVVKK